jgi:molybdenum cofactor cytidylyltransferase
MEVLGILLAAGRGRRFDPSAQRLKLLEPLACATSAQAHALRYPGDGATAPMAAMAAATLRAALGPVIAVVRPDAGAGQAQLRALLAEAGCTLVYCDPAGGSAEGMGASIASAVRAYPRCAGWVVALADMPQVRADTVAAVGRAIAAGAECAVPYYRGLRGHPVGFGAGCREELAALAGDTGARAIVDRHRLVRIEVDDPGILVDIDVPDDLAMLRRTACGRIP